MKLGGSRASAILEENEEDGGGLVDMLGKWELRVGLMFRIPKVSIRDSTEEDGEEGVEMVAVVSEVAAGVVRPEASADDVGEEIAVVLMLWVA